MVDGTVRVTIDVDSVVLVVKLLVVVGTVTVVVVSFVLVVELLVVVGTVTVTIDVDSVVFVV